MGKRLALIVGNSVYQDHTLARLKAPEVDIGALHEVLKDPEVGGFEDVDLLVNGKSATIRRAISEFFARKGRDDLLLLYFSGHGVLDDSGRLFLAVKDTDHSLLRGTAVAAGFIADEMDNSRSQRQILILDCCHSGAFARGTKGAAGISVGTASAFEGTGFGRVVLTATDATQYAWEGERIIGDTDSSLFTHYMVEGLQSGEADMNGDGQITIDELYDYVYEQVIQQTPNQTPGKWSFKEQGDLVIAKAGHREQAKRFVEAQPYLEAEQQQKLEQLYTKGLSAYWLEEWEQAAYHFQSILEIAADYQDAAEKFSEVRRQITLKKTYEVGLAALEDQKYSEALSALEGLVAEAPDYKDAATRLQSARKQASLADLYAQAKQLHQAQQWQAVINIFDRIAELTPDYLDADGLLPSAKLAFERQKHLTELQSRYQQALKAMNSGEWLEARDIFERIQEQEPGFEDTTRLLERVEAEISRQERQRQVQERVESLYEQAISLALTRQWRGALEKIKEIETLEAKFDDPEGIASKAKAELLKEEQEARRQSELAGLYAEAVRLLQGGHYREALEKWGEVQAIKPDYLDRYRVQKTARQRLAAQAKPGSGARQLSIRKYVLPGLLGLALVVMAIVLGLSSGIFTPKGPVGATEVANLAYTYERTFGETGVPYMADGYHYDQPVDVAVDPDGNIAIVESRGQRLTKLFANGVPMFTVGEAGVEGSDDIHFSNPSGVAFDAGGNIYVADCANDRVQIFSSSGTWVGKIRGGPGMGNYQFEFNCPSGVAFDRTGNFYITDANNHRVLIFDSNLIYKATLGVSGEAGSDTDHFNWPNDIDVDGEGNMYVADTLNQRVQVFDSHGTWQKTLGVTGSCGHDNDHFCEPWGVALDPAGNLYVAEKLNSRVQVFDNSGAYLTTIGGVAGSQNGQFRELYGVDVDTQGNVYVADLLNQRVEKYSPVKD